MVELVEALPADKGYDTDSMHETLTKAEVDAAIPTTRNRRAPLSHDRQKFRWRNLIERLFS
ncbi:hypothetical protein U1763_20510 [Sphingomonas sp. LB2R24]|uniref:hypothetical protein n=1 Tax=Sphingomonas sorbitolis TaxID=3096165 RepID=UPI002FC92364